MLNRTHSFHRSWPVAPNVISGKTRFQFIHFKNKEYDVECYIYTGCLKASGGDRGLE